MKCWKTLALQEEPVEERSSWKKIYDYKERALKKREG